MSLSFSYEKCYLEFETYFLAFFEISDLYIRIRDKIMYFSFAPFLQRSSPSRTCPQGWDACQIRSPELLNFDMVVDIHRVLTSVTPELLDELPGHLCPPEMSSEEMPETMWSEFFVQGTARIMQT